MRNAIYLAKYPKVTIKYKKIPKSTKNTYKNLKLRPILELWGQIGDLTAFQPFLTLTSAENLKNAKVSV